MITSIFADCSGIKQEQKENWKIHKNVEIKQHTLKQLLGQKRNFQKGDWGTCQRNEYEKTPY